MEKNVELTEEGIAAAELALDTDDLWSEKDPWARHAIFYFYWIYLGYLLL